MHRCGFRRFRLREWLALGLLAARVMPAQQGPDPARPSAPTQPAPSTALYDIGDVRRMLGTGADGRRWLYERLFDEHDLTARLDALAAVGKAAGDGAAAVAPFVRHPDLAVREHAAACLRAIAGDAAVIAAHTAPDPWPRIRAMQAGDAAASLGLAFDAAMPSVLRRRALTACTGSEHPLPVRRRILPLLIDADPGLAQEAAARCVSDRELLFRTDGRHGDTILPEITDALCNAARPVRTELLMAIRCHLAAPWPEAKRRAEAVAAPAPAPVLAVARANAAIDRLLRLGDAEFASAWDEHHETTGADGDHRDAYAQRIAAGIARGVFPADASAIGTVFERQPGPALELARQHGVPFADVLANALATPPADRVAGAAPTLIKSALTCGSIAAIQRCGAILAIAPEVDATAIVERVARREERLFALQLLRAIGPAAAAAAPAVAAIAALDDEPTRFLAPNVLAHLGPAGVRRLVPMLVDHREWISSLDLVLCGDDDPSLEAAANAYLALHLDPNAERARLLREALRRPHAAITTSSLVLALLATDPVPTDADWLRIAVLEPALVRRRALEAFGERPRTPLQLAVLAELLTDPDADVRQASATLLLAEPAHVLACRRALTEFAADPDTAPATKAQVRAALARLR